MRNHLTRRDFLTVSGLSVASLLGGSLLSSTIRQPTTAPARPNLIIIVFDTLSARHISLHGYPRPTTPNLDAFANQAFVYHAHHAPGNYTIPSTASLLTGFYPWNHGAYNNLPEANTATQNIFQAFQSHYTTAAFIQNLLADFILDQYDKFLDLHPKLDEFSLTSSQLYAAANRIFDKDNLAAALSTQNFLYSTRDRPGSLFFSLIDRFSAQALQTVYQRQYREEYPYGLPFSFLNNMLFAQRPVFDGVADLLIGLPSPSLAYLHFWSPHEPYRPHKDFSGIFADHPWQPLEKPAQVLGALGYSQARLNSARTRYDEGLAHIDAEFGRLIEQLRANGLLDNSTIIVTSDHGQLFERGIEGHSNPLLYEPLLHVPLLIRTPGQNQRQDIHNLTSSIDLLPTLLHLSGLPVPTWVEGQILPGLGGVDNPQRAIFAIDSKESSSNDPLEHYSLAIYKAEYKLTVYNYLHHERQVELYNLADDPEELNELSQRKTNLTQELQAELRSDLNKARQPIVF
jgi:arylsulfatase A-like enzyme